MRPQKIPTPVPPRERILQTAHTLFYRDGIRATGIDRIIAEATVTKVTFYRHFPSKNDLIRAFLEHRHQLWIQWFGQTLTQYGGKLDALLPTLTKWFHRDDFRGCAFINSVGELGAVLPDVMDISRRHKTDMTVLIAALLPSSKTRMKIAQALALAVDGAIFRAQLDETPEAALKALGTLLKALRMSLIK